MEYICIKHENTNGFVAYSIGDIFELVTSAECVVVPETYFRLRHIKTNQTCYHKKENFISVQEIRDNKLTKLGI